MDEFGNVQSDHSGVTVTVTDVSPQITAQTAADGSFGLSGVPDGTHTLSYTKGSYGTYALSDAVMKSGQLTQQSPVKMSRITSSVVTFATIQPYGSPIHAGYIVSGSVSPLPTTTQPRPHRLFMQAYDYVVVKQPIDRNHDLTLLGHTKANGTFTDTLTMTQLQNAKFVIGAGPVRVLVWGTGDNPAASTYTGRNTANLPVTVYPAANVSLQSPQTEFTPYF